MANPTPISLKPVVLKEPYNSNFLLAFRMGYTNIKPQDGRIFKERHNGNNNL